MGDQRAILDRACRTTYHEQDDKIVVNVYQDVGPHLEYAAKCRRAEAEGRGSFGKRSDLHRTMSVPFNIIAAVAQRLGIPQGLAMQPEYSKRIWTELKRSEFKPFRVTNDKRIG
jgi:hypothetical protein